MPNVKPPQAQLESSCYPKASVITCSAVSYKVEKWYDLYEKHRLKFESFADFVDWYNTVRFHESLDTINYLQTPLDAFWSRLPEECKLNVFRHCARLDRLIMRSNIDSEVTNCIAIMLKFLLFRNYAVYRRTIPVFLNRMEAEMNA